MKQIKWKQILSGVMAVMTVLTSTVPSMNVYAAESGETLPPVYEEVKEYLSADEVVTAADYEIDYGAAFDVEHDLTGIEIHDESKVSVKLHKAENDAGEQFDSSHADTYRTVYYVEPASGNPTYQISRNITVKEPEEMTSAKSETVSGNDAGGEQEAESEDDGEAEPDTQITPETQTETETQADLEIQTEPDTEMETVMPEETAGKVLAEAVEPEEATDIILEESDNAVVVFPSRAMARASGSASLEVGKKVSYPGNLGNYATHYFYVNGRLAYCLESMKGNPAFGDYAYEVLTSNAKALYYGYGGAGDLTEQYIPQFDADLRYVFTHLAASYFYCGTDAFHGCSMQDIIDCGVWGYIEFLASQPEPIDPYISLSKGGLTATYDRTKQVTDKMTLNGDSRNYITLNLPKDVTFHNTNTGAEKTGGSVNVHGGTTFYFTAPTSVTTDWSTGEMYGSTSTAWKAIVVKTAEGKQDIGSYYEESQRNSVSFSVDWLELARVGVYKVDSKVADAKLAGAVFGIYKDKACTQLITKIPKTDANGYAEAEIVKTQDTVYLKEITAPKGYRRNTTAYNVKLIANETTTVTVPDVEQMAELTVYKEGQVLAGADVTEQGVTFRYENKRLSNAVYNVYAGENIYTGYGALVYSKGDLVRENLTTNGDGLVVLKNLHLGTYLVKEVQAPSDYVLNDTEKTVVLSYGGQEVEGVFGSATFVNDRQKASVSVVKQDKDTLNPLDGGVFGLYASSDITDVNNKTVVTKGTLIETVTTGEDGTAAFASDLPIGFSYNVKEIKAPYGYYRNTKEVYSFDFSYTNSKETLVKFQHTFSNERVNARIQLVKKDKETGAAQGDATLEGAVYGLYARKDIVHPDGATGILYAAGEQVATLTTDKAGKASVENLYLGNYYVKEITASEGYLLDEAEYDLTCDYEGDLTATVERSCTSLEQVKKQPFQLIKVSDNGDDTEAPLLKDAGFTAYLKSSLFVKKDGSYDFDSAVPVVIGKNGATEISSDETGHVVSIAIPYGTYVVVESTTPHNMETIKPFEVKIAEHKPNTPQTWRVFIDREFTAKLRILKKDGKTGQTVLVPNAEFKIYNLDKKEYVKQYTTYPSKEEHTSFFTDADGDLILPEMLKIGNYRIEEVAAPDGYIVNDNHVTFAVDTDTAYEVDQDTFEAIISADYVDMPAVGELTVEKKGEILDGYKGGLFADSEEKEFVYKEGSLAGAVFEIYAAEDIYTNDFQVNENGERNRYYSRGDLVATLETDENGKAALSDLPLGSYLVVETKAPFGYVLNQEEQTVTFAYVDDKTPVIYETAVFSNDRQKVALSVLKKDKETEAVLAGAEFGLYAAEDIVNEAGEVIVEEDTLLERAVSGTDGKAVFAKDYPLGMYYAKEIKAPLGYVSSKETVLFDASYQGQAMQTVKLESEFINTPTTVEITKKDITSKAELSGATLSVFDKDGKLVDTWTSKAGEAHVIKRLHVGETYTLREEFAPYGYLQAEEIRFTVADTEKVQPVTMQDEVPTGTILINKDGEFLSDIRQVKGHWYDFVFDYFKKSLAGVTFEVYAAEDIVNTDGTVVVAKDTLVEKAVTGKDGKCVFTSDLPLGQYEVKEITAPKGYVLNDEVFKVDASYQGEKTAVLEFEAEFENFPTKLTISKTDITGEQELEGARLSIIDKDGTVVETWVSDGKPHIMERIPVGEYILREEAAPYGYKIANDVKFTVENTKEIQKVSMKDELAIGKIIIEKTDENTKQGIGGVEFEIRDKDGKVIEKLITDRNGHAESKELPIGIFKDGKFVEDIKYYVVETKAAEGYIFDATPHEVVLQYDDEAPEIVTYTLSVTNKPTEPKLPQTGDNMNLWLFVGIGAVAIIAGIVFYRRKTK